MFEFIKLAHEKLDDLARKDQRYEAVTKPLQTLLSLINGEFLSFKNVHQNVSKETFEQHQLISKRYEDVIKNLYNEIEASKDVIKRRILDQQNLNESNHKTIDLETQNIIDSIQKEIKELEQDLKDKKDQAGSIKAKSVAYVDKVIIDIRKQSTESIAQIKASYETDLAKINKIYLENEALILDEIKVFDLEYDRKRHVIQTTKNAYREQSDAKYLSVKNDYHQASTTFNKSIDSLKKQKEANLHIAKTDYQKAILPIEKDLKKFEETYLAKKQQIESEYQLKLQNQKELIIEITNDYNQKKNQKIKETSESITLLNSKLSAFRENTTKDRQELLQLYKDNVAVANTDDEKKFLNKEKNKALRVQDNDLNKQINRTMKETHAKTKQQYVYLGNLESDFLNKRTKWRIDGKILVINYKLSNINNDLTYQFNQKVIDTKLKKLKQVYDFNVDMIEQTYLEGIAPQEYVLSIANALSERDVNLLSNDTNYHLNHYQLQEDTLDYDLQIFHFNQNEKLDIEKLYLEHQRNLLDIKLQLLIDKENVIREQQLKNQNHKKELALLTYDLANSNEDLTYLLSKAHLSNQMDYQIKRRQSTKDFYDKDTNFDIENFKSERSYLDEQIHFNEKVERVNSEVEMLSKDLNVVHSRIHYLFNQIYVIYNIHHRFMLEMVNLYQLPAHPEDVKYFITLYLEVFKYLRQIQEYAKDEFQIDMKQYHETKINDLTNSRLKTSTDQLKIELNDKLKNLDDEMIYIDKHITKLEDQIFVLSTNVDRIQSDINSIEQNKDEDTKKLSRQQQSDKEILLRQINALESEINLLDKSVSKYQGELDKLSNQKQHLVLVFEKQVKSLENKLKEHASVYLNHLSFYQIIMKKLTKLFLSYEAKITPLTHKLNQPIYITDNVMKEYQKSYAKIEDFFEKQSHSHYQSLLKGSMKLFDSMVKELNQKKMHLTKNQDLTTLKYDKQKALVNQQKNDLLEKHKHNQISLNKEEILVLESIKLGIHKDKHRFISGIKDSISMTEKQIMTTEQRLTSEMTLIDANLTSVISQMESEYLKSKTKLQESYKKNCTKSLENITLKQKALKQLEETTQLKNKLIQNRFAQTESKLAEVLKDKQNNFLQLKDKKSSIHQKKIEDFDQDIKLINEKTVTSLNINQKKYQLIAEKIETFEQNLYQKELKDSKKSYAYKQKTLRL